MITAFPQNSLISQGPHGFRGFDRGRKWVVLAYRFSYLTYAYNPYTSSTVFVSDMNSDNNLKSSIEDSDALETREVLASVFN
jgi:hypothetical protein